MTETTPIADPCARCSGEGVVTQRDTPVLCPSCDGSRIRGVRNLFPHLTPVPTVRTLMAPLAKCSPQKYPPAMPIGPFVRTEGRVFVLGVARPGKTFELPVTRAELETLVGAAAALLDVEES